MLLVATAALQDPHFADTVVLLLDVSDEGALGVVLNRPSQILVADVLEPWRDVVDHPEVLFRGGPVGVDGAIAVGCLRTIDEIAGWGTMSAERRLEVWQRIDQRRASASRPDASASEAGAQDSPGSEASAATRH